MTSIMDSLRRIKYQPRVADSYHPGIGLVGCGGITPYHLKAYRDGGLDVVALCDLRIEAAKERRDEFFPDAAVYDDVADLLALDSVEVVDISTHPPERPPLIEAALRAGKHVLSQKPFVLDLEVGERLCRVADDCGRLLAVNQNARWAPHFAFAREVVAAGLIGDVTGVHLSVHWDHHWVKGTQFELVPDLILYDYAIHWFDILSCFIDSPPQSVYASTASTRRQSIPPPLLGQAIVEYENAQASLAFDADTPIGPQDRTFIAGSRGSIRSTGPGNLKQTLVVETEEGEFSPSLKGVWFPDAFLGTMGELLRAVEQQRKPILDARANLQSLSLCFAAVESSKRRQPVEVGDVRKLPESSL